MNAITKAIKLAKTQTRLAHISGVSQAAISKLEAGKSICSAETAIKFEFGLKSIGQPMPRNEFRPDIFGTLEQAA